MELKNYSSKFLVGGLNFLKIPRCAYQVGEQGNIIFFPKHPHTIEFHIIVNIEIPEKDKIAETLKEAVEICQQNVNYFQLKECFNQIPTTEQEIYQFLFELCHSIDADREPKSHYRTCITHLCNFIALSSGFLYRVSENGSFLEGFIDPVTQCDPLIQSYGTFYNQYLSCACVKEVLITKACRCFNFWRRVLTSLKAYL